MRTLILQRHAKSDYPPGVIDHERPLSMRGRRDAPAAGEWLAAHDLAPERVLISTAVRTRQTWDLIGPHLPATSLTFDDRIYEASVVALLGVLAEVSDDVDSVMIVGHNPGLEMLATYLARGGSATAMAAMSEKFPTSAIAVLHSEEPWAQFASAELVDFAVPRG